MRSNLKSILRQRLSSSKLLTLRSMTTTSNSRKKFELAIGVESESLPTGTIQESLLPSLEMPNANIVTYAFRDMHKWQHKTFTECGVTGKKYSFGQTMDGALRWASAIKKLLPNNPNPTVSFISPNSPDYVTLFYGCLAAGCTVSPINPMYKQDEVSFHLRDSNTDLLIVDPLFESLADLSVTKSGSNIPIIVIGQSQNGRPNAVEITNDPLYPMADPIDADPESIAFLPYSSGTTGKPKGVSLSHAAITNNMAMFMHPSICAAVPAEGDHQEVNLGILPFFHIYGLMATLMNNTLYGGKIVTLPKFDPTLFISMLKKHKVTALHVVPPLLQFISECPLITKEDLSQLHSFIVGGAPVPEAAARNQKLKTPNAILQEGYGMTESLFTHITALGKEKIGSCGQLLSNVKAKIIDLDTEKMLPPNAVGELCLQTPSIMTGYYNNQMATDDLIDSEGWLHTGDIAHYTEDGYFSIVDRLKELIKYKALQVAPSELEETLRMLPNIEDAGVVGVTHNKFGEVPVAFIVKSDDSLTEDNVHKHMREHLAEHKQLHGGIVFVDELPKSQTGKLLRRVLKEMAEKY